MQGPQQPSQPQTQTKITMVRHAESQFNIASHNYRVQHNLPYIWELLCQDRGFVIGVKYNPNYLDCDITETGVNQCVKAQKRVKDIKPDIILVSPLFRTLRTCSIVFEHHKDVPVVVEPLLAEAFRSSCDIASETKPKMQQFPTYDFGPVLQQGDFWFVKNESQANQKAYFEQLAKHEGKPYRQQMQELLKFMTETMLYETPEQIRRRSYKIKEMISEKYAKKYRHIAIVAHYNVINFMMAEKFDEKSEPVDFAGVGNCEVVHNTLEEMLKHK